VSAAVELCDEARELARRAPGSIAHRRGAAFIGRQAIELATRNALGHYDVKEMRWRSRFLVLATVAPMTNARRGYLLWSSWSEICHYHPYDLVPNEAVITMRLDETRKWIVGATNA
jgi:hypothetical protein